MTQKPNDRYYTVAEVRRAKELRANLIQLIRDCMPDLIMRGETRAVMGDDGLFRHVSAFDSEEDLIGGGWDRLYEKAKPYRIVDQAKNNFDQVMDEYLDRKRFEDVNNGLAWMDDPDFCKTIRVTKGHGPHERVISFKDMMVEEAQEMLDALAQAFAGPPFVGGIVEGVNEGDHSLIDTQYPMMVDEYQRRIVDPIRQDVFNKAMVKFSNDEIIFDTEGNPMTGFVLAGYLEGLRRLSGFNGDPICQERTNELLNADTYENFDIGMVDKRPSRSYSVKRIKASDHAEIIQNRDPDENMDVCSNPKFRGDQ